MSKAEVVLLQKRVVVASLEVRLAEEEAAVAVHGMALQDAIATHDPPSCSPPNLASTVETVEEGVEEVSRQAQLPQYDPWAAAVNDLDFSFLGGGGFDELFPSAFDMGVVRSPTPLVPFLG